MSERAETIRKSLEALRDKKTGTIRPSVVVRAARSRSHPLHSEFIWDNAKAAKKQREDRAYELIQHYCTVVVVNATKTIVAPAYARDPRLPKNEKGLVLITHESLAREDASAILIHAFSQCAGHIERARDQAAVLDKKFPGLSVWLDRMLDDLLEKREELKRAA